MSTKKTKTSPIKSSANPARLEIYLTPEIAVKHETASTEIIFEELTEPVHWETAQLAKLTKDQLAKLLRGEAMLVLRVVYVEPTKVQVTCLPITGPA